MKSTTYVSLSILTFLIQNISSFTPSSSSPTSPISQLQLNQHNTQQSTATKILSSLDASSSSSSTRTLETNPNVKPSSEWELDCYSRPVMVGGKKLWEVLITDSSGSFRLCETLPSNK